MFFADLIKSVSQNIYIYTYNIAPTILLVYNFECLFSVLFYIYFYFCFAGYFYLALFSLKSQILARLNYFTIARHFYRIFFIGP